MAIIEAQNISMTYTMPADRITSLKEYLITVIKRTNQKREFHALSNVNLSIEKGEVLGIIGNNGAGKSTLLKIISGILKPTTGKVVCHGNIVPMLELGSGLDYDLSGRENIFLSGSILGYSKKLLESKYDAIVAFSELQEFIEAPIRNYSSGMVMRLAFSIASVVEPEILIVDEILSVGDEHFQQKSRSRMMEMMKGGTTVLFVSHSIDQIMEMSSRVLWLDHGWMMRIGDPETVCREYSALNK